MIGVLMNSNKKIVLLFHFFQCNGSYTSIIDLYFNLIKCGIDVKLYIILNNSSSTLFFKTLNEFPKFEFTLIKKDNLNILNDTTIITTAGTVYNLYDKIITLKYNKIIILDGGIFFSNYSIGINNNIYNDIDNRLILGNPFNSRYFTDNYFIYYHKFSLSRLEHLKKKYTKNINLKEVLIRNEVSTGQNKLIKISDFHSYKSYSYKRWFQKNPKLSYFENIGKLIFEYKYMNKKVFYSAKNKTIDDGLTDYLRLFNINDNLDQEITITSEEVIDKLGFKNNDLILELIDNI